MRSPAELSAGTRHRRLPSNELMSSGTMFSQRARPRPRPSTLAIHPNPHLAGHPSMEGKTINTKLRLGSSGCGSACATAAAAAVTTKYVKVDMQGAPYLRKVDLRAYRGHAELRAALFGLAGQQLDLVVAYEDQDGDIMLACDLPWDMFVSNCKKIMIVRR